MVEWESVLVRAFCVVWNAMDGVLAVDEDGGEYSFVSTGREGTQPSAAIEAGVLSLS